MTTICTLNDRRIGQKGCVKSHVILDHFNVGSTKSTERPMGIERNLLVLSVIFLALKNKGISLFILLPSLSQGIVV